MARHHCTCTKYTKYLEWHLSSCMALNFLFVRRPSIYYEPSHTNSASAALACQAVQSSYMQKKKRDPWKKPPLPILVRVLSRHLICTLYKTPSYMHKDEKSLQHTLLRRPPYAEPMPLTVNIRQWQPRAEFANPLPNSYCLRPVWSARCLGSARPRVRRRSTYDSSGAVRWRSCSRRRPPTR